VKLLLNNDKTAESLEVAGNHTGAGGQQAVVDPGKEFRPDPRAVAREEKVNGAGQPRANKDVAVDDVAMANAIEAAKEVKTITTLEATS